MLLLGTPLNFVNVPATTTLHQPARPARTPTSNPVPRLLLKALSASAVVQSRDASADGPVDVGEGPSEDHFLPSACAPSAKTMPFDPGPVLVEKSRRVPPERVARRIFVATLLTFSKYPPTADDPAVGLHCDGLTSSLGPLSDLVLNPASTVPSEFSRAMRLPTVPLTVLEAPLTTILSACIATECTSKSNP